MLRETYRLWRDILVVAVMLLVFVYGSLTLVARGGVASEPILETVEAVAVVR